MRDVVVVGAGLFGSIIAKALRQQGHDVLVLDCERSEAGSKAAACLMKPGWFSSLGKSVYTPALAALNSLYKVQTLEFLVGGFKKASVMWIPPAEILLTDYQVANVRRLTKSSKGWVLLLDEDKELEARRVILATGIWTSLLAPEAAQKGLAGVAYLWPRAKIEQPFIRPWAPYKQLVVFNRGDGIWASDGTAILRNNWTAQNDARCLAHCSSAVERAKPPVRLFGIRPYHEAKPCLLSEVRPKLWVATGGAKNGTLAAGWCASQLMRALT